jgi:cell division protein FtsB
MAWYNPWAVIATLKDNVANLNVVVSKYEEQIKKLEFTKKENEREIKLLEKDLKEAKAALAEASKNDTRDTKGRFTKAKK